MKLILSNITATIVSATDEEHLWLDNVLRWPDKSAKYRQYYTGDGYIHLYDRFRGTFPAGFMRQVYDAAKADGVRIQLADKRTRPCEVDPDADLDWLRDYQREAVDAATRRARGVWWCPTGSGKTEMAVGLATALPCRWLFLAHRADLVIMAAERYEKRTGAPAGIIGDGKWEVERFTAATFQTLYSRIKKKDADAVSLLQTTQGLLIDEVHTLPATSYLKVSLAAPNAYYRIGMSGTPLARDDEKSMHVIGATGPVIYRIPAKELIDSGDLAQPEIKMVRCLQTLKLKPTKNARARAKIWARVNDKLIINSEGRNKLIVQMAEWAAKPALVFVHRLEHGKNLEAAVRAAGMSVEFVSGNKPTPARIEAVKRLERGDVDVLICTVIFNEGVDIPELRSVVIASGGKSAIAALQRIGRGMRTAGGTKHTFEVWDVYDEGSLLENHSKKRKKAYAIEGYEVETVD